MIHCYLHKSLAGTHIQQDQSQPLCEFWFKLSFLSCRTFRWSSNYLALFKRPLKCGESIQMYGLYAWYTYTLAANPCMWKKKETRWVQTRRSWVNIDNEGIRGGGGIVIKEIVENSFSAENRVPK